LAVHGMVIHQQLARASAQGGVTVTDTEPGLAEMRRPIVF
jgi:hypothetical protein